MLPLTLLFQSRSRLQVKRQTFTVLHRPTIIPSTDTRILPEMDNSITWLWIIMAFIRPIHTATLTPMVQLLWDSRTKIVIYLIQLWEIASNRTVAHSIKLRLLYTNPQSTMTYINLRAWTVTITRLSNIRKRVRLVIATRVKWWTYKVYLLNSSTYRKLVPSNTISKKLRTSTFWWEIRELLRPRLIAQLCKIIVILAIRQKTLATWTVIPLWDSRRVPGSVLMHTKAIFETKSLKKKIRRPKE